MNNAQIGYVDITIASGQQTSGEADLSDGRTLVGVIMPGTITSTALTFSTSDISGGTYSAIYGTDGNALSVTVAASRYVPLNPTNFAGARFVKVVGGTSEGGTRVIKLVVRHV